MNMKSIFAVSVVTSLALASTASALTISTIDGAWENASAGVSGTGTESIRWGKGWMGGDQSGYDFSPFSDVPFEAAEETPFVLGTFDHLNFPVTGTFLETVDLAVNFTVEGVANAISTVFSFSHNETYNWAKSCANGANYEGLNVNGCSDQVTATLNEAKSETFEIDGVTYLLDILGFQYQGELFQDFWTIEEEINSAELIAIFRKEEGENPPPPPPPPSEVPLPASGLLLLAGVAGLYMKKRRDDA